MRSQLILKIGVIYFFLVADGFALKISDSYDEAKVGQWILMKSSDGLLTRTAVVAKGDGKLTLRIKSFKGDQLISNSEETIDVEQGRVLGIRIYEGNRVKEINPKKTDLDEFFHVSFDHEGQEEVAVEKGFFHCERFKGIYKDRVVTAWINHDVPILHLVKVSMKGVTVELVDYAQ